MGLMDSSAATNPATTLAKLKRIFGSHPLHPTT